MKEKSSTTSRIKKRKSLISLSIQSTPQIDQSENKLNKRNKLDDDIFNVDYIKKKAKDENNDFFSIDDMLKAQNILFIEKASKFEANLQQTIKRKRFLKLKKKKASVVSLLIIIQIEKNIYLFILTEANVLSKNF